MEGNEKQRRRGECVYERERELEESARERERAEGERDQKKKGSGEGERERGRGVENVRHLCHIGRDVVCSDVA